MKSDRNFGKISFDIRVLVCFFLIMLGFLSCILKIAVIGSGNYSKVQAEQSSYRFEIGRVRGTIFDCNRIPITNAKTKEIAAVLPQKASYNWLCEKVDTDNRESLIEKLKGDTPFLIEVTEKVNGEGMLSTTQYIHNYKGMPAAHIVGYVDSTGHGVSGLEKAYDELLYSDSPISAVFKTDGAGGVLRGEEIEIENNTEMVASGVVSTIDINIQTAVEELGSKIEKGAVVVAEAQSGKIRAMASFPNYDVTAVADYLKADNSPLLNRCLSAYNVGSAFKPCVAAAALQLSKGNTLVNCNGFETITDRNFSCHEKSGHGTVDLKGAISQSCNVFFYNMALNLGADAVYNMASSLWFGQRIKLCEGIYTANGNLTKRGYLNNDAELANLSIGQGRLLLTPVSMLTLYSAIATDGTYRLPTVVEGVLQGGKFIQNEQSLPTRVMSAEAAMHLREDLAEVIKSGTGGAANPKTCSAAGKTATAQTGKYKNGVEITHSWFCGFFPADNPKYVAVVMVEGGVGSAEIFANIADSIAEQSPDF